MALDPQILDLLADPETHAPLELGDNCLIYPKSGRRYPIREGIAVFLQEVSGPNQKYQTMYDRLAPGYDLAERLYYWISRKPDRRLGFIPELEIPAGGRVLEVSVGTGGNLPFLRRDVEFFGLDLSWGMLRRCRRNLKRWRRSANLFHGEAERLPFRDAAFDCVYHVGGINFFSDKARAITEMIRVAKPNTKIMIVDETEKVVSQQYRKNPFTRRYYASEDRSASAPIALVPDGMREIQSRLVSAGNEYCLTFRKP
jgi:ubiquinone/menaquinone biosynthesis C-methylase UbiE